MFKLPRQPKKAGGRVLDSAASPTRMQILLLLNSKGNLLYSDIMGLLGLNPSRDAGKFAYHLRSVLRAGLIDADRDTRKYKLTDLGKLVVNFYQDVEEYSLRRTGKLLVRSSRLAIEEFNRGKIAQALIREAGTPTELAQRIAQEAEQKLLNLQVKYLTAPLIREFVNAILIEKGLEEYRHKLTRIGLPVYDVGQLIKSPEMRTSNSDSIHIRAGDSVMEEYVLINVLPREIADAHLSGSIHIANTGNWILKPDKVLHDIRVFLANGLRTTAVSGVGATLGPPKSLEGALFVLTNMIRSTSNEVSQDQGLDYFNIFLAPYAKGMTSEELHKTLRTFMLGLNQPVSGERCAEVSIGVELEVPDHLANVHAVCPDTQIASSYGDFRLESTLLAESILGCMVEDDESKPMFNPQIILKARRNVDGDDITRGLIEKAHNLASKYGLPYFANTSGDWQRNATYLADGSRLRDDWTGDWELDTLRVSPLNNIAINLPRLAYECKGDDDRFLDALDERLKMAYRALELKYRAIEERMRQGFLPILSTSSNGEPYLRIQNSLRTVSLAGLNEAVMAHTNSSIHESKDAMKFGLKIATHLSGSAQKHSEKPAVRIAAAQVSDIDSVRTMAELDVERYGWSNARAQGPRADPYYTDLVATPLETEISWQRRVQIEGNFQRLALGGHLSVLQMHDSEVNPDVLTNASKEIIQQDLGFYTFTRNVSFCSQCRSVLSGLRRKCPGCGSSTSLTHFVRLTAKYQPLRWWEDVDRELVSRRQSYDFEVK